MKQLALKIDVDTYDGMRLGVPNLLKLFKEQKIKASFFVPFGPDQSGRAIFRVFKNKGFLKKMFRTNALKLYGFKTMLRGTFLPAPMIGSSFPALVKEILDDGHELGLHGYNHVLWQDHLLNLSESKIREQYELGIAAYKKAVGVSPRSFAAPAWLCSPASLRILDRLVFDYASDTRGQFPFYPTMEGEEFRTPQVPSTLPTSDELLGEKDLNPETLHGHLTKLLEESQLKLNVHTVHTEAEGMALLESFSKWVKELKEKDIRFVRLTDYVESSRSAGKGIPRRAVQLSEIPGRSGRVACQQI